MADLGMKRDYQPIITFSKSRRRASIPKRNDKRLTHSINLDSEH
jgi:hypothetical protein